LTPPETDDVVTVAAPRRLGRVLLILAGLSVCCVVGVCGLVAAVAPSLPELAGCPTATAPVTAPVRDDTARLRELLPALGELRSAHWQVREARPRLCPDIGPMDYIYEAVVVLPVGGAQRLTAGYDFAPAAAPEVPAALAGEVPAAPAWQTSARYDATLAPGARAWLDVATETMFVYYLRG